MKTAAVAEASEMTMTERSQSFRTFMDSELHHLFTGAVLAQAITAEKVTGRRFVRT